MSALLAPQMDTAPSRPLHSRSPYTSHPAPTKVPSILQKSEAEVLEQQPAPATPAAATGMPHDALRLDGSELRPGSARPSAFTSLADKSGPAADASAKAAEAAAEPSTPPAGAAASRFSGAEKVVEDSARKGQGALTSAEESG